MSGTAGLVYSYLLDGKGGGTAVGWSEIDKWQINQGLLWIHMDSTSPEAEAWLREQSGFKPLTCESLLDEETRPRNTLTEDGLLLILRGVNCNPGEDPEDMVAIRMLFTEHRIITMRYRRVMAIQDVRQAIEARNGPKTAGGVSGDDHRTNRGPHG